MNIKNTLKKIKLNESTISMLLGALVIVVIGVLVINYFRGLDSGTTEPTLETEDQVIANLPTTHTVASGENLWKISEQYYGTGYNWVDIVEANNLETPSNIVEGQELEIPNVDSRAIGQTIDESENLADAQVTPTTMEIQETPTPTQVLTATPTETPSENTEDSEEEISEPFTGDTYTVVSGDSLWKIAQRVYGDPYKWVDIAKANDLINPNIIHPGNVFVIPN